MHSTVPKKLVSKVSCNGVHVDVGDRIHEAVAGVVDPDVDALKVVQGEADDAVDLFAVADIAGERQCVFGVADAFAGGFGASRIAREQHHPGALIGKQFGDGFSDAHGSAGDHHNFSGNTDLAIAHLQVCPLFFAIFAALCDLCGKVFEAQSVLRTKPDSPPNSASPLSGAYNQGIRPAPAGKPWSFCVSLLPLFPLDLVLFPGTPLPLHIFEPRYREMISECLDQKKSFGVVRAKEEGVAEIGCTAEIITVTKNIPTAAWIS